MQCQRSWEFGCAGLKWNKWYWAEFEPWYKNNLSRIEEYVEENLSGGTSSGESVWVERRRKARALLDEIELKEKQGKTLDKDKVTQLIKSIASSQSIILRNLSETLPHKLYGRSIPEIRDVLTEEYNKVCGLIHQPINKWGDMPIEDKNEHDDFTI